MIIQPALIKLSLPGNRFIEIRRETIPEDWAFKLSTWTECGWLSDESDSLLGDFVRRVVCMEACCPKAGIVIRLNLAPNTKMV